MTTATLHHKYDDVLDRHLSVALVVDLSKPEELWLTVDRWLEVIKARVTATLQDTQHTDQSLKEKLRQSTWQRVGAEHEVIAVIIVIVIIIIAVVIVI